jgi:hypothetical protein
VAPPAEVEEAVRDAVPAATATVPPTSVADVMRTAAVGEPALARAAAPAPARRGRPAPRRHGKALLADASPEVRAWACGPRRGRRRVGAPAARVLRRARPRPRGPRRRGRGRGLFGHDDVAVPFVKALGSEHPGLVVNAARALASVNDPRAVGAIVRRMISHGGGVRAVVEFLNKVSYIRDYDVEIAQAANIANPVIGTAVEGMVFDVKIVDVGMDRTVVETILVDAFNKLTGLHARNVAEAIELYRARATTWPDFPKNPEPKRKPVVTQKG